MINPGTGRCLPFDFYIPEFSLIIELDGNQHFVQVSNWECSSETQTRDIMKMNSALQHGLSVIRLYQPEVLSRDWSFELFRKTYVRNYPRPIVECIGRKYNNTIYSEYVLRDVVNSLIEIVS
jgi:hypothetical protein